MAQVLKMPRLSDTMVEGVLVRWHKKEGDPVEPGEVLAEVETDKATMELESFDSGVLAKILLQEGQGVPVGGPVAIVAEEEGEDISSVLSSLGGGGGAATKPEAKPEAAKAEAKPEAAKAEAKPGAAKAEAGTGTQTEAATAKGAPQREAAQKTVAREVAQHAVEPGQPVESRPAPRSGDVSIPGKTVPPGADDAFSAPGSKPIEPSAGRLATPDAQAAKTSGGAGGGGSAPDGGRVKASPLAKKIASENHIELGGIPGSGPGGRIIRRDIERALETGAEPAPTEERPAPQAARPAPPAPQGQPAEGERVPLSQMRKTIARRMTEAKQTIPHFYLTAEIEMGPAVALRQQLNDAAGGSVKVSINDLIIKACAAALVQHPRINAIYEGDHLVIPPSVHMGFAVAIEDGLITPTIRDCQTKSIGQIAKESRELADRAAAKKLRPEDYTGATFAVSNLGMYGIVEFVAIINPPQSAILAVGAVRDIPVVVDGQLAVAKRMRVTLSCDHRVMDGAQGAQFLATLRDILEHPMRLLL